MFRDDLSMVQRRELMVNNELLSDIVFIVGAKRQRIFGHKTFLISASQYFYIMFQGYFRESVAKEIEMDDIEPDLFLQIMRFIYSGNIELTPDNVHKLYTHAQKYMLPELMTIARAYLVRCIKSKTLQMFVENRQCGFDFVDELCLSLLYDNPLFYFNQEAFCNLDYASLKQIFSARQINCTDDQLLEALDIWRKSNKDENYEDLRTVICERKRSYNCNTLRVLGELRECDMHTLHSSFKIVSSSPIALYGLGIYLKSKSKFGTIEVKIEEQDDERELSSDVFEYTNKDPCGVNVAELFFERLLLLPQCKYKITLILGPTFEPFTIMRPRIFHDSFLIEYDNYESSNTPIAHMHCKEHSDDDGLGCQ